MKKKNEILVCTIRIPHLEWKEGLRRVQVFATFKPLQYDYLVQSFQYSFCKCFEY